MKKTLIVLLVFSYTCMPAQYITTYYFNADFALTTVSDYQYKATVECAKKYPEGAVKIRVELKNGKLIHKYQYSDLEKGLKMDTTLIFNEDGTLYSITPYNKKGEMESEMIFYKNGKLSLETYFKNNVKNGVSRYYYEDGKLHNLDHYENGLLTDTSYNYNESGIINEKKLYSNGFLSKTYTFSNTGNLKFEYSFNADGDTISTVKHSTDSDIDSIMEQVKLQEEFPEYKGGVSALYKYLSTKIKYPRDARDNSIQGKTIVKFSVDETGKIHNIKTINPIYPLIDFEAMRVINEMPAWTPGKQNGKNVEVWFTLPVSFKLD